MNVAHGASSPDDSVLDLIEWKSSAVYVPMDPDLADADALRDQSLLAYVVPRPGGPRPEAARLREHAAAALVPNRIVVLDVFPLTANGMITAPMLPRPRVEQATVRAAGSVAKVCDIIADRLELPAVKPAEDLFELGGYWRDGDHDRPGREARLTTGPAPEWTRGAGESNLRWGLAMGDVDG